MKRTVLQPSTVHAPFSNYSHGIVVDGATQFIFCAGQVAADSEGNIVGEGDFEAQVEQVMSNVRNVLAEGGATLEDVVKVTLYVVERQDTQKAREILRRHFRDHPPASTLCVLQGLADPRFLVEIEAIAVVF